LGVPENNATTTTGGIYVTEDDAIFLGNVVAGAGDVVIENLTQNMTVGYVEATTGGVFLTATLGSILDGDTTAMDIVARNTSSLWAGSGVIGGSPVNGIDIASNPLEVKITNGDLMVYAMRMNNFVSVNINGIVFPRDTLEIIDTPPGLVIFNNRILGGVMAEEVWRDLWPDGLTDRYDLDVWDQWLLGPITDDMFAEDLGKDDFELTLKKLMKKGPRR